MVTFHLDTVFEGFGRLDLNRVVSDETILTTLEPSDSQQPDEGRPSNLLRRRQPRHELRVHFPALDLLPDEAKVSLPATFGLPFRTIPTKDVYQLESYPPDFVCKLGPVRGTAPASVKADDARQLFHNFNSLGQTEGVTLLYILPCITEGEAPVYIFRRETYFGHKTEYNSLAEFRDEKEGSYHDYYLTEINFHALLRSGALWVPLLEDLVLRRSGQAVLYVDSVLESRRNEHIDTSTVREGP